MSPRFLPSIAECWRLPTSQIALTVGVVVKYPRSASALMDPVIQRVRVSARHWASTGGLTGVPSGIPVDLPGTPAAPLLRKGVAGSGGFQSG